MSLDLQLKRGTTVKHNTFTGKVGEVTVDTDKDTLVVHDGTTVGGFPLAKESAVTTSLALKVNNSEKGVANGVATLDVNGKVVLTQIPDSVLGQLEYMGVHNFTTMPTATQKGQYWIANTSGNGYVVGDWAVWNGTAFDKVDNTDAVATVAGRTGNVVLTKTDVGLANVDNTSDANKPVSTAQQTAINTKVAKVTSTDNAIVRFNGTTGEVQNSGVTIDDANNVILKGTTTSGVGLFLKTSDNSDSLCAFGDSSQIIGGTKDTLTSIYSRLGVPIAFNLGSTERMRISSVGNLLIGTTTDNGVDKLQVNGSISATNLNGNSSTATVLQIARTINGVSFNGSANIVVPNDTTIIEW